MNFLTLEFIPLTFDHKPLIESFLEKYPQNLTEYNFAYLISANTIFSYAYAILEDETLLISFSDDVTKQRHLLQPIGNFSEIEENKLLTLLSKNPYPVKILAVSDPFLENHSSFCSHFTDFNDCNLADYFYKSEDLAFLHGRHYEKKRNLIAQANRLYSWKREEIDKRHHPHCLSILENIGKELQSEKPKDLENERKILHAMLSHFDQLDQKGCVITIDNQPVAFSIYGKLNNNIADIFFEKADRKYKGISQVINQETAKLIFEEGYEWINREEDLGLAGLRQAKLSYHPYKLINYHILTWK